MFASKRTVLRVLPVVMATIAGGGLDPGSAAYAAIGPAPPSVTVPVKDLDLTTHAGVVTLYRRIRAAARSVCGDVNIVYLEQRAESDRCVDRTIGDAVAKVGNANLTDYYLTKTRRPQLITTARNSRPAR
jgi:UrcA family protein